MNQNELVLNNSQNKDNLIEELKPFMPIESIENINQIEEKE